MFHLWVRWKLGESYQTRRISYITSGNPCSSEKEKAINSSKQLIATRFSSNWVPQYFRWSQLSIIWLYWTNCPMFPNVEQWNEENILNLLNGTHTYTGRFIMFSVITNIYNKKTKWPTLMELFTATGKLKKFFFWQLMMFDVCTTGDTAHIDTIFKFLPHTRQRVWQELEYRIDVCRITRGVHIEHL